MTTQHPPRPSRRSARKAFTALSALGIALTTFVTTASSASALAPANDNYANRATLTKDTPVDLAFAGATSEPGIDGEAAAACGMPPMDPAAQSVWFDITPTVTERLGLILNTSSGGVDASVVTGEPGSFVCVTQVFNATAGVTYHLLLNDAFGFGNTGSVTLITAPVPPTISSVTVDPVAAIDHTTNVVTVSGTYTCASNEPTANLIMFASGVLTQRNGQFAVVDGLGVFFTAAVCDSTPQRWTATSSGLATGLWQPGAATADWERGLAVCGLIECTFAAIPPGSLTLRSVKGQPAPPPPPPVPTGLTVTVDKAPILDRSTNVVTLGGTFNCTGGDEAFLTGVLRQVATAGMFVDGWVINLDLGQCTGSTQRWSAATMSSNVVVPNDLFSGGPATFSATALTCPDFSCGNFTTVDAKVKLKAIGKKPAKGARPSQLAPGVAVNFDRRAVLDLGTNTAAVTGAITCAGADSATFTTTDLAQLVGRINVRSFGFAGPFGLTNPCDGAPHRFTLLESPYNGWYAPGKAVETAFIGLNSTDASGNPVFNDGGVARGDIRLVLAKPGK